MPLKLREHARRHIRNTQGYRVNGPRIEKRRLGGYRIIDAETEYTYGTARRSPEFTAALEVPAFAPPAGFIAPNIPVALCGVGSCAFTPHGDTPHTWEINQ